MGKSWLLCVLLGTFAWGQTPSGTTAAPAQQSPSQQAPMQAPGAIAKPDAPAPAAEVPENAVVLTIKGVCPPAPVATKAGAAKPATAKKPADCKTEITRAQFEKIANGISPTVTPQLKRQLEMALPRFMAMSEAAKKKGLENSEQYKETLKLAKMQILTTALQRSLQEEADKVTPEQVAAYYKQSPEAYEQFSLDRLFIPRYKTIEAEDKEDEAKDQNDKDKEDQKAAEEKQKAKEAEEQAKKEKGEQELNKLADTLRERAAAGEDFTKLQKEAFEASGTKVEIGRAHV